MGGCCFTPSKKEFLWWYWLLLASVLGIPIFVAAWSVKRKAEASLPDKGKTDEGTSLLTPEREEKKRQLGKSANRTFKLALLASFLIALVCSFNLRTKGWPYVLSGMGYLFGIMIANAANNAARKRSTLVGRIIAVVLYVCLWYILLFSAYALYTKPAMRSLAGPAMTFGVCMLPAHFWGIFAIRPTQKTAWRFVGAFLVGILLYWGVVRFGDTASLYVNKLARGTMPTSLEVAQSLE